jgi:hypothetical protein
MTGPVLLLACYELGHQPLSLAWPLALLRRAGYVVTAVDLAVERLPQHLATEAGFVAIAAPMHTALRLGVAAARQIRAANPGVHICFFGLYAWLNADYLLAETADSVIGGEYEQPLLELVAAVRRGAPLPLSVRTPTRPAAPYLGRHSLPAPDRSSLPPLGRYAYYVEDGRANLSGYVEASRGCLHHCRHCPVVPIYNGRFFVVPLETVLADVDQQVQAGATHITFGDPDFLNGPGHALKVARALHARFPTVGFDFTTKVEHILKHRRPLAELRALGATFLVSAFESTSQVVLNRLAKGHTPADLDEALGVLAAAGLPVQPTWVPFTPWTALDDYLDMLAWIRKRDLIAHVPAVQYGIRLLIPPGSALLDRAGSPAWLGDLDAQNFTYQWCHPDPRLDRLYGAVCQLLADLPPDHDPYDAFVAVEGLAHAVAARRYAAPRRPATATVRPPRLTEDWFC